MSQLMGPHFWMGPKAYSSLNQWNHWPTSGVLRGKKTQHSRYEHIQKRAHCIQAQDRASVGAMQSARKIAAGGVVSLGAKRNKGSRTGIVVKRRGLSTNLKEFIIKNLFLIFLY